VLDAYDDALRRYEVDLVAWRSRHPDEPATADGD